MKDEDIHAACDMIRRAIPRKGDYEQKVLKCILDLIEQSDYGKKNAQTEAELPIMSGVNEFVELMYDFNKGRQWILDFLSPTIGTHGTVSITEPNKGSIGLRRIAMEFKLDK